MQSPEGQALRQEDIEPGWADMLLDFSINYLSVTPPQMTAGDLREVLFELFPRKVSTTPDEAEGIVREFRAFWTFMQREFQLANAAECLKTLDEKAARRLKKELDNPANFGIAKSFVMMGLQRGFDLSSEESINEWMETYNAELAAGGPHIPLPGEQSASATRFHNQLQPRAGGKKRKKNRKRR
ncbi:MAG TPA: hypothetical protein VKT25_08270 [Ktedonobacteraceae bacterium]|nr:hypothetical protein [Ktedonobacteraceae bacterium]